MIYILNLYQGKDDVLNTGNYMERVVDEMIREIVGRWLRYYLMRIMRLC